MIKIFDKEIIKPENLLKVKLWWFYGLIVFVSLYIGAYSALASIGYKLPMIAFQSQVEEMGGRIYKNRLDLLYDKLFRLQERIYNLEYQLELKPSEIGKKLLINLQLQEKNLQKEIEEEEKAFKKK